MSLKKQPAFVCDVTDEASMNEADFYAFKLPGERKSRHVHKEKNAEATFASVMDTVIAKSKATTNGDAESATEPAKADTKK